MEILDTYIPPNLRLFVGENSQIPISSKIRSVPLLQKWTARKSFLLPYEWRCESSAKETPPYWPFLWKWYDQNWAGIRVWLDSSKSVSTLCYRPIVLTAMIIMLVQLILVKFFFLKNRGRYMALDNRYKINQSS